MIRESIQMGDSEFDLGINLINYFHKLWFGHNCRDICYWVLKEISGFLGFDALPYGDSFQTPSGYKFEMISLPGHAPDLRGFVERTQGWAFLGDMMQPQYQQLFGSTCEIQEDIQTIAESLERLYSFTEGIPNLQLFVAGKGVFIGRDLIRTRLNEIYSIHTQIHEIYHSLDISLTPDKKIKKILKTLWGGESMFGGLTAGELSRANFVTSCLKWNRDVPLQLRR